MLLAALLGGCGDDSASSANDPSDSDSSSEPTEPASESPSPSDTPPPLPDWPACSDVWVKDATIPQGYKGCLEGDQAVKSDTLSCSSGQRIIRYDDRFFGVAGGKIYEAMGPLEKDKQYLKMVRVCRA